MRIAKRLNFARLFALLVLIGPGSALLSFTEAAKLYKWIDEDGNVRYSDRLPAEQAKKKHQQIDNRGFVVSTTEDARTQEEIAAETEARQEEEKAAAEAARLKAIQDQKDQVLLLTFSSEEEIALVRDNRIGVIDSVIRLINKSITATEERLALLQKNADDIYLSQGKEVPGGLAQKIEQFTAKLEGRYKQLAQKEAEKAKINQQFEIDMARFRYLKSKEE